VKSQSSIITVGIAPVDEIDIQTRAEQPPDERSVRLQVEYIRAIHQSETDEQRPDRGGSCEPLVPVQRNLILPPHDMLAGAPRRICARTPRRAPRICRTWSELQLSRQTDPNHPDRTARVDQVRLELAEPFAVNDLGIDLLRAVDPERVDRWRALTRSTCAMHPLQTPSKALRRRTVDFNPI
jgi:hypothetical protein